MPGAFSTAGLPLRSMIVGLVLGCGVGRLDLPSHALSLLPSGSRFHPKFFAASVADSAYAIPSGVSMSRRFFAPSDVPRATAFKGGTAWSDGPYSSVFSALPSLVYSQVLCPTPPAPTCTHISTDESPVKTLSRHGVRIISKVRPKKVVELPKMCPNPLFNSTTSMSASQLTDMINKSLLDDTLCAFHGDLCMDISPATDKKGDPVVEAGILFLGYPYFAWFAGSLRRRMLRMAIVRFRRYARHLFWPKRLSWARRLSWRAAVYIFAGIRFASISWLYLIHLQDLFTEFVILELSLGTAVCLTYVVVSIDKWLAWIYAPGSIPKGQHRRHRRIVRRMQMASTIRIPTSAIPVTDPLLGYVSTRRYLSTRVDASTSTDATTAVPIKITASSSNKGTQTIDFTPHASTKDIQTDDAVSDTSDADAVTQENLFPSKDEIKVRKRASRYNPIGLLRVVKKVARVGPMVLVLVEHKTTKGRYMLRSSDIDGPYKRNAMAELRALSVFTRHKCAWATNLATNAFVSGDKVHVLTFYYPRGTMRNYMFDNLGYLDHEVAAFYTAELFVAIQAMHRLGVIHLRMSLDDILLTEDGHIVLSNFAFAKVFEDGIVPEYIGPRDALEDVMFTGAVDYHYLALAHHEMLTGRVLEYILPYPSRTCQVNYRQEPTDIEVNFWSIILDEYPYKPPDLKEIMWHQLFDDVDWAAVSNRTLVPPVCSSYERNYWDEEKLAEFEQERVDWETQRQEALGSDEQEVSTPVYDDVFT